MKNRFYSGKWGSCHCQGIAFDRTRTHIYYSFTTKLVKCALDGTVVGTVDHIVGHLGCIAFNDRDDKLYASLEYKNDPIGRGILASLGYGEENLEDGFYVAIFDVDRIDRIGMDAEKDHIMRVVYLPTVVEDYNGVVKRDGREYPHILGCSGIDGITFGPEFGAPRELAQYLYVAYGVYSDPSRCDNDHQVLLQYDASSWWETIAQPLSQKQMHHEGPRVPRNKYFVYTGNTTYGIQNLEYDSWTGNFFAAVYTGKKPEFPNYALFCIDGSTPPRRVPLKGCSFEGDLLSLKPCGECEGEIYGSRFPYGSIGMYSMGDGTFYIAIPDHSDRKELAAEVRRYRLILEKDQFTFSEIPEEDA